MEHGGECGDSRGRTLNWALNPAESRVREAGRSSSAGGGSTAPGHTNLASRLGSATSGYMIFTVLSLSLLIHKMGIKQLSCL